MHPQTVKLDLRAQVDVTIRGMFQRGNVVASPTRNKDIHGNISDEIKRSLHSLRVTFSERKYALTNETRRSR